MENIQRQKWRGEKKRESEIERGKRKQGEKERSTEKGRCE